MSHDEMIAVIQAHKEGKQIQYRSQLTPVWTPANGPSWDFASFEYRAKPDEPRDFFLLRAGNPIYAASYEIRFFGDGTKLPEWRGYEKVIHVREVIEEGK